jgi:hypothetical protein
MDQRISAPPKKYLAHPTEALKNLGPKFGINNRFAWTGPDNIEEKVGVKNRGVTQISRT